jgi:repressor LexA
MSKLTPTQAKALDYIKSSIDRSGVAPTLREICSYMGYKAVGSAQDLVSALRKKGFIEENERQAARTYLLTSLARRQQHTADDGDFNTFVVPCLGTVPAGNPALAVEERIGTLRMSIALLPKPYPRADELFALQAVGESMVNAGIFDGDWLVVRLRQEPPRDSIVVARVDGDVTVKRLMRDRERGWYLQPENARFHNIYADEASSFEIVGQVVALQRALA